MLPGKILPHFHDSIREAMRQDEMLCSVKMNSSVSAAIIFHRSWPDMLDMSLGELDVDVI